VCTITAAYSIFHPIACNRLLRILGRYNVKYNKNTCVPHCTGIIFIHSYLVMYPYVNMYRGTGLDWPNVYFTVVQSRMFESHHFREP
jgi:hypothetical protein